MPDKSCVYIPNHQINKYLIQDIILYLETFGGYKFTIKMNFSKDSMWMENKHMKTCSTLLDIREI